MIAESLRPPRVDSFRKPTAMRDELIVCNDNWRRVEPRLSVLVPMYHDDASRLISQLARCRHADQTEIIIFDDGSGDTELTQIVRTAVEAYPGAAMLVTCSVNAGRSAGRNRLEQLARSDWMIYLDADMLPDDSGFFERYLKVIEDRGQPVLVVGGFSMKQVEPTPETELHWMQCASSECIPASERNTNPGRFVFTSNVLVHRDIMTVAPFDGEFSGWGWEDVDWGLRAAGRFPVIHIDNTATHLGLDSPSVLMKKYKNSGANFWLAASRHPEALRRTSLYIVSKLLSYLPGRTVLRWTFGGIVRLPSWLAPLPLKLFALKFYRAAAYAGARHD